MARKLAAVVFSLGALQAETAFALGLGELKLESYLNEPLRASVDLLNTGSLHEDEIRIRLATRDDFKKLGIDRSFFLTNIDFDVEVDESGRARIVMTSDEPVLEPYLDFIVEARWPSGRLLREYTVLIDPPVFADGTVSEVVSASERVEQVEGIPAPAKKKSPDLSSSGTTVGVKKSDLAPGMMPQRDFSAATSPVPMAGSKYMIHRDQTLWEIAAQARPDGVSVHQTMLDIQRLNPAAFIDGNINQIKAGYIVYLPSSDDISSGDMAAALAEVKLQNEAWQQRRAGEPVSTGGPSLRISAEPEVDAAAADEAGSGDAVAGTASADDTVSGAGDAGDSASAGDTARMAALQRQIETLERMVDIKDEQIAALQSELTSSPEGAQPEDMAAADETSMADSYPQDDMADMGDAEDLEDSDTYADVTDSEDVLPEEDSESTAEPVLDEVAEAPAPAPEAESTPAPAPKAVTRSEPEAAGGFMDYIYYILGALALAVIGFFVVRRRGAAEDEDYDAFDDDEDVFSDVQLRDDEVEVEAPTTVLAGEELAGSSADEDATRGYGERKHDEYASDVEAADALAEADIYIAYGRHRQAIDLLENALENEPGNPVYRLKLIEIYSELSDRGAASAQMEQLQQSGDEASIARGQALLDRFDEEGDSGAAPAIDDSARGSSGKPEVSGLAPNPLDLLPESDAGLESEFSGLEIEPGEVTEEDELDLSADFESGSDTGDEEDDLVIAADANGLSTKMDLARAYLDMGDDDGARQILEEVVAEGGEELQAEARALLDRIG